MGCLQEIFHVFIESTCALGLTHSQDNVTSNTGNHYYKHVEQ